MTGFKYHEIMQDGLWEPERFPNAIATFTDGMTALQEDGLIEGAFIHGRSAAYLAGEPVDTNVRSDLDVVIIPTSKDPDTLSAIRDIARDIYLRHGIESEPWCFTREQLATGDHNLDGSFQAWMEALITSQSPDNPLSAPIRDLYILPPEAVEDTYPGEHSMDRYFGQRYDIEQAYLRGVFHDVPNTLDHVLKFPFETGREVFGHLNFLDMLPQEITALGLQRAGVTAAMYWLSEHVDDPDLVTLYEEAQRDEVAYTVFLGEVRAGTVTEAEYEQVLGETLSYALPKTLEVTERLRSAYKKYCLQRHAVSNNSRTTSDTAEPVRR